MRYLQDILPALPASQGLPIGPRQCYYAFGLDPATKRPKTLPCYSVEELIQTCARMTDAGLNVYFAQAAYTDATKGRKQANVRGLRALWADIDVGKKNNSYATRDDALNSIVAFARDTGLTPSYVVSSGMGFYCYWCLDTEMPPAKWQKLAQWLAEVMTAKGLIYDPACTTDSARVLRLPGTIHRSTGTTVKVAGWSKIVYSLDTLGAKLYAVQPPSWAGQPEMPAVQTPAAQAPMPANVALDTAQCFTSPAPIVACAEPVVSNCRQILEAGLGTEPQWYAMMSVLRRCTDGREWAHALSQLDTVRYNAADTEAKFDHAPVDAPARCDTFALLNPGGCKGCKYRGTIASPIQLWRLTGGAVTPAEEPADEEPEPAPAPVADAARLTLPPVFTYTPKSFTSPEYYVNAAGCHWVETKMKKSGEYETTDHLITHSQLYYVKTVWTYKDGKSQREHWFQVINPNGHREQVSLDASIASSAQQLMAWLYSSNIFPAHISYTAKVFMGFINAYLNSVLNQNAMEEVSTSDTFGWKQANPVTGQAEGFAIGEGLVTEQGIEAQEYTGVATKLAKGLGSTGTLDGWKPVAQMYKTLDQKAAQLGICLSLAAPFMKYGSGVATSATYSLWSTQSGLGKTQLLRAAASVWGNPDAQFIQRNASAVARMRQLAVLNNLPAFMDELTDVSDEDLYALAYSLVGGQEKNKLKRNGAEMVDTGTWNTVTFITSNKSIKEAVARCSGDSSASVTRVIEYECDFQSYAHDEMMTEYINSCIGACVTNYGVAGPNLMYNVLLHKDRLAGLTAQLEHWVTKNKFANEERFMAFPLAIALKIGRWAVEWGILDYDMDALEQWVLNVFVPHNRTRTTEQVRTPRTVLLSYLVERQRNLLQVTEDIRTTPIPAPSMPDSYVLIAPSHADTLLRMTVAEGRLYIAKSDLDKWCKRQGHSAGNLWRSLAAEGVDHVVANYNLGMGTSFVITPTVPCYVLEGDAVRRLGFKPEAPSQQNGANMIATPFK